MVFTAGSFGPVVPELRIVQPELVCAERDLYLHGIIAYVIESFIIIHAMRIAELECFQLAHVIAPEKSDSSAFRLRRADHPIEQIVVAIAFHYQVDVATLWYSSGFAG